MKNLLILRWELWGISLGLALMSSVAAVESASAPPAFPANATGVNGRPNRGSPPAAPSQTGASLFSLTPLQAQSYLFLRPKTTTRARIAQAQMLHRGDANRRRASQSSTNNNTNAASASTTAPTTAQSNNSTAPAVAPFYGPPTFITGTFTNSSRTNITAKAEAEGPRPTPLHEVSGPPYNDGDPLLGYQLEQADKGNPESQYAIGLRYLTGTGVVQSDAIGRQWLERASTNGNLRARTKLHELDGEH